MIKSSRSICLRATTALILALSFVIYCAGSVQAHPLGNFTINHFARIEVGFERVAVRYVVDMAEISTLQELQASDTDGDGTASDAELTAYLERAVPAYTQGLLLTVDGVRVPLTLIAQKGMTQPGAGGLSTLRVECDFNGVLPARAAETTRRLRFEDVNHAERLGWHEIVVNPAAGVSVFNTNAYGSAVTDELIAYPQDRLAAPLDERVAELSFKQGMAPAGATALRSRESVRVNQAPNIMTDGASASSLQNIPSARPAPPPDRLAALIAVPQLTPMIALLGLFIAMMLGALHALSPGHGKTVVGAYLVGSRGTAKHAMFLGLTVTITHTLGVFALGLVTLFASQYVVPERLFPILSFASGAIVVVIGLSLFVKRLRSALGIAAHSHTHLHEHDHTHHEHENEEHTAPALLHDQAHMQAHTHQEHVSGEHSHGGRAHTHLPPGADGSPVTWRSLLALGISGGLLPCPSALVVLLSAISLHRVGYGLILVIAFSLGLACTLTGIGLAFVYAGRVMKRRANTSGRLVRVLPALSAFVIMCVGAAICYEALAQAGVSMALGGDLFNLLLGRSNRPAASISSAGVLALGLVFGLKHAVEADHLAAVSTIVSERKSLLSSSVVGGLWGIGHTISLLVAGVVVILLHIEIGERTALALEFGVALMLIALGVNALRKLLGGGTLHLHAHRHGRHAHLHPHLHDAEPLNEPHTHHGYQLSARPILIGMVHGLAGSAALMLLVLSTIPSAGVGLAYIFVFGVGSVGGMMLMSALVGLPLQLTARRFTRMNAALRGLAGIFSLCFGLFMVYRIGFADGLFR